jgi:peptidyl-prolyl cis-trans isomerase C
MRITGKFITVAATVLTLSTPGFAQEAPTKETVVATVNGTVITLGHVLALANRLPDQYMGIEDKNLYAGIVDQLIQQQLLSDLIKEETSELKLASENERRSFLATEAIEDIYDEALSEEAVNARYAATYLNAAPILEFNASHILVETEEKAKAIVLQLADGADFAKLAREESTGPSGPSGGSLGWAKKGSFVPEFEVAMIGLEVGGVSEPVKTQFGWHVIKLNETRNQPATKLVVVRDEIEDGLRDEALKKRISELEASGSIERKDQDIDPSVVKQFELLKD